jgi:DNA-binding NarL/FixJ family response regulator
MHQPDSRQGPGRQVVSIGGRSLRAWRGASNPLPGGAGRQERARVVIVASRSEAHRKRWRKAIPTACAVHEAADRLALEAAMACRRPDAVVLDLDLLRLGGIEGLPAIQRIWPSARILLLTSHPDDREGLLALKAGVRGYCHREIEAALLAKAVRVVQAGEIWIARKVIPRLLDELTVLAEPRTERRPPDLDARLARVTPRQRQIMQLLSAGGTNKDIAAQLNVAERTVKAHLSAIFTKLGVSGRLRLALSVHGQAPPPAPAEAPGRPAADALSGPAGHQPGHAGHRPARGAEGVSR